MNRCILVFEKINAPILQKIKRSLPCGFNIHMQIFQNIFLKIFQMRIIVIG